jgi:16S rRNA (adenine1518-N6/adenine1519-N6)-dimethyltransferase
MDCWNSSTELRNYIFESLKQLQIKPSNQRGQNFLIDANIIHFQIKQADIHPKDTILEIGGGLGNLTKCLAQKAKKVYVIENDRRIFNFLNDKYGVHSNIEIIYGDAVKLDFPFFTKCISNIPFQISSPITFKLLDYSFDLGIIMYQKEFAQRLFAEPGTKDYSRIAVMIQSRAVCKYLKTVKPTSFYPSPKIHSALVSIQKLKKELVKDLNNFSKFSTLLFTNKKKTVRNILVNLLKRKAKQNITLPDKVLETVPHLERRVFTLTIDELNEIFKILKKRIGEDLWSDITSQNTK